jgi:hypothetical protein
MIHEMLMGILVYAVLERLEKVRALQELQQSLPKTGMALFFRFSYKS